MKKIYNFLFASFFGILFLLNIICCDEINAEEYSLSCNATIWSESNPQGYMHNNGEKLFYVKYFGTEWRIFEKEGNVLKNQYFCLERNVEITPANKKYEVYPVKSDEIKDENRYLHLNKSQYAAIGRFLYKYISDASCTDDRYIKTQLNIHKFMNAIGKGDAIPDGATIDEETYKKAYDDYLYYNYSNTNLNIRNGLNFTKSGDEYVSNSLNITITKPSGATDEYATEYKYDLKINGVIVKSNQTLGNDKKVRFLSTDLSGATNTVELIIKASRDFYMPNHYSAETGAQGYQDIVATKVTKETKTITQVLSINLNLGNNVIINKVNASENNILNKNTGFELFVGSNCSGVSNRNITIGATGTTSLYLLPGSYSLKEVIKPEGYSCVNDDCCTNFQVQNTGTTIVNVKNIPSGCVQDVKGKLSGGLTIQERVEIYKEYPNYNVLLDFNKTGAGKTDEQFAQEICAYRACHNEMNVQCLSAKSIGDISDNDWSCYNNTINIGGKTGYCNLKFIFNPNSEIIPNNSHSSVTILGNDIKNGQFIFGRNDKEFVLGTGSLTQSCYFSQNPNVNEIDIGTYSSYVNKIEFNGQQLATKQDLNTSVKINKSSSSNGTYKYTQTINIDYLTPEIYVEKISGRPCSNITSPKCVYIGNGLISNFNDAIGTYNIKNVNFKIEIGTKLNVFNPQDTIRSVNSCYYTIDPEIITYDDNDKGNIELEFRIIDTNTPFSRNTKTNWCNITAERTDCSSTNNTVVTYIINKNNSYDRTGTGTLYTNQTSGRKRIILTPNLIQEIRGYNETHPYDDYEISCDINGQNCGNAFLKGFNIVKNN